MESTNDELGVSVDGPPSASQGRSEGVSVEANVGDRELKSGLAVLQTAVDLMCSSKYLEAVRLLKPKAESSIYHCMAYGTVVFLQAGFCMEREAIDMATEVLTKAVELCNSYRKPRGMMESLSGWVFGQRLDSHTILELQAEVFHAEANLLLSFLTFLQDESLMSFVKGGLRIRSCFSSYKQLFQWLSTCEQEGLRVEENFATGVWMGYGCFNLFLSLLPARILKVLEFVGFAVDRKLGLQLLEKGAANSTFRAPLCSSFLLFYYTVAAVITGVEIQVEHAQELLRPQLDKYPQSVHFLYFKGRTEAMAGKMEEAIGSFQAAIDAQEEWKQVRHLCWWEMAWCHSLQSNWKVAAHYSDLLFKESKWSKAFFLYMKASFLLMEREFSSQSGSSSCDDAVTDEQLAEMMRNIPSLKQRIAGRSLPIEKFAVAKSERFLAGATLPLSGMELLYSHNAFLLLRNNQPLLQQLLRQIWDKLLHLEKTKETNSQYHDDWTVITFVQGCVFRVMERHDEAEKCFLDVIKKADTLEHDLYTIPAASAELGLLYITTGRLEEAQKYLDGARANYKGYHLESRIHFRIHAGINKIQQLRP